MKIIYNNLIPFPGYKIINLFGVLFVRKGSKVTDVDMNHEKIHSAQMKDITPILFYLWYVVEWLIRLMQFGSDAYYNISFEREAYCNESNLDYLNKRKKLSFLEYIK